MKPAIRRVHSPDVDDPKTFIPSADRFAVLLQFMIGPEDGPGEESFDLLVCSPSYLAERAASEGMVEVQDTVVMTTYDWEAAYAFVQRLVDQTVGDTWEAIGTRLARHLGWEFEGYQRL